MTSSQPVVLVRQVLDVAYLQLNRPRQANAINSELATAALDALAILSTTPSIRAIIITGMGKHFSAGADLKAIDQQRINGDSNPVARLCEGVAKLRLPTVACVNGAAIGGGCELALACDFRVMSTSATMALPEIRFGMLPAAGGTQRLPRLIGHAAAKRMIFTGDAVSAEHCLQTGLVDRTAEPHALEATTADFVAGFSDKASYALSTAKQLIDGSFDQPLAERLQRESDDIANMGTPDERRAERIRAQQSDGVYNKLFS